MIQGMALGVTDFDCGMRPVGVVKMQPHVIRSLIFLNPSAVAGEAHDFRTEPELGEIDLWVPQSTIGPPSSMRRWRRSWMTGFPAASVVNLPCAFQL